MRRQEKAMSEEAAVQEVILRSQVCRLAMTDGQRPYIVPLSFGYEPGFLYFHCATEGRKLDLIRKNDAVCFEFDVETEIIKAPQACNWTMKYKSVIGFGKATVVEGVQEKRQGLNVIMKHYSGEEYPFPQESIERTVVIKVAIESMTGKKSRC